MDKICIAGALLVDSDNRLLVVRKSTSTYFMMAGGKLQGEESYEQALVRELQEELGLSVEVEALRYLGEHCTKAVNELNTLVEAKIYFLRLDRNVSVYPKAEIEEVAWLTSENYGQFKLAHLLKEFTIPRWLELGPNL